MSENEVQNIQRDPNLHHKKKNTKRHDTPNEVGSRTNMSDILNNLVFPKCFH